MKKLLRKIGIFLNFIDPPTTKIILVEGKVINKRITLIKNVSLFIVKKELLSKSNQSLASNTMMIARDDAKQLAKFIYEHT